MNAEIDCTFFKITDETISPVLFVDDSDLGIHKLQIFASNNMTFESGKSGLIKTNLGLSCKIQEKYIKDFRGILELFLVIDTNTFGFLQDSEMTTSRTVLLTPIVHSISMEICFPQIFNLSCDDLYIKKQDSLGFLQFVLRGIPDICFNIQEDQKLICKKCKKIFESDTKLNKHFQQKHAYDE